jgi:F0F1-type ATP synthase assembly protein I
MTRGDSKSDWDDAARESERDGEETLPEVELPDPARPPEIPELLRHPAPKADPYVGSRFGNSNRGQADTMGQLGRVMAIGTNFAAIVGAGCLLGWLLDRWLKSSPTCLLIGLAVGLIGGGYGFVREARKAATGWKPPTRKK